MNNKNVETIGIVAIVAVAIVMMLNSGGITGFAVKKSSIPDEQCYNLASNLDKSVSNRNLPIYYSGTGQNPCTKTQMNYTTYLDPEKGPARRVYENGDAVGGNMLTDYILCTSTGKAEVITRLGAYYFNRGNYAWGLWLFNPHLANQYKIEKCSTI